MKQLSKFLKTLFIVALAMIYWTLVPAQDTTIVDSTGIGDGGDTVPGSGFFEKLGIIIPAILVLYEAIARLIPSVKDYSLINKIIAIIQVISDKILPNQKKTGGTHENAVVKNTTTN